MPPPGIEQRLSTIFRAAFNLEGDAVQRASRDTIATWDSIAAMTLAALIEEEFGQTFDLEEAAEWSSYEQVYSALRGRLGA
jgi:acyl carrier protein